MLNDEYKKLKSNRKKQNINNIKEYNMSIPWPQYDVLNMSDDCKATCMVIKTATEAICMVIKTATEAICMVIKTAIRRL